MRTPTYASKKARAATGWWKHARPLGKRMANKSERKGAKRALVAGDRSPLDIADSGFSNTY